MSLVQIYLDAVTHQVITSEELATSLETTTASIALSESSPLDLSG